MVQQSMMIVLQVECTKKVTICITVSGASMSSKVQQSMVLVLQVECTKKVTICIAVNGAPMCSKNQSCPPIAKRLAKPRVAGNRHKLRLTGLSNHVKGPQGLQFLLCSHMFSLPTILRQIFY